jgi:hypothetical protein
MTVFDSIRYPISNPPTEKELGDLPAELYDKWIESYHTDASGMLAAIRPSIQARILKMSYAGAFTRYEAVRSVKLLRKMISEYEPQ